MTDTVIASLLDQFVEKTNEKRDLERQINLLKKELAPIEAQLLDEYAEEGLRKKTTSDGVSVWVNRKIWARAGEHGKPHACEALRRVGLDGFIEEGFNTNALSKHFRDLAKDYQEEHGTPPSLDDLLPAELGDAISLTEDFKLGLTSS